MKESVNPYRIISVYGAWVVLKAELNEDLFPKLRNLVIVGKPYPTEQLAESFLQIVLEEERAGRKFGPKMCSTCKTIKEPGEFNMHGEKLNYECKLCRSKRSSVKASRVKAIPVRPNTRGLCETGTDNRKKV